MNDRMVWIDCEMTGLSLADDALIEVAALVTDSELNVLGDGVDIVIRPPAAALETMPDVVRTMHTSSGLLEELSGGTTLAEAEEPGPRLRARARQGARARPRCAATRSAPTAASSPATCRPWRSTCTTGSWTSPRSRSCRAAGTRGRTSTARTRTATTAHWPTSARSIAELRYYREAVFVPQPGPDTDTARAIAARHVLPAAPH